jgi:uncharacterized protein with NRDE domain
MPARLLLLRALETSLRASHEAILARDLAGLQLLTAEQATLQHKLATRAPEDSAAGAASVSSALYDAHWRALQMGRIQSALLRRALQSLRTLAHLLASRSSAYTLPLGGTVPARRYQPFMKEG